MENWLEIMPALPAAEAKKRLAEWKAREAATGKHISDDDIREDIVRAAAGKCLLRYCVRR